MIDAFIEIPPYRITSLDIRTVDPSDLYPLQPGSLWLLYQAAVAPTSLSGQVNDMSMNNYFFATVSSTNPDDISWFTGGHA